MKEVICLSMMCGLSREGFRRCERLMSVSVTAGASRAALPDGRVGRIETRFST
jgi:hypothetical protein